MNNPKRRNNSLYNKVLVMKNIKTNDSSLRTSSLNPDTLFTGLSRQFKIINSCLSILEATRKERVLHLPWLTKLNRSSNQSKVIAKKLRVNIRKQYSNNLYARLLRRIKPEHCKVNSSLVKKEEPLISNDNFSPSCMKIKYNYRNKTLNTKNIRLIAKSAKASESSHKNIKRSIVFSSIAPIHDELGSSSSSDFEAIYNPILNPKFVRSLDKKSKVFT